MSDPALIVMIEDTVTDFNQHISALSKAHVRVIARYNQGNLDVATRPIVANWIAQWALQLKMGLRPSRVPNIGASAVQSGARPGVDDQYNGYQHQQRAQGVNGYAAAEARGVSPVHRGAAVPPPSGDMHVFRPSQPMRLTLHEEPASGHGYPTGTQGTHRAAEAADWEAGRHMSYAGRGTVHGNRSEFHRDSGPRARDQGGAGDWYCEAGDDSPVGRERRGRFPERAFGGWADTDPLPSARDDVYHPGGRSSPAPRSPQERPQQERAALVVTEVRHNPAAKTSGRGKGVTAWGNAKGGTRGAAEREAMAFRGRSRCSPPHLAGDRFAALRPRDDPPTDPPPPEGSPPRRPARPGPGSPTARRPPERPALSARAQGGKYKAPGQPDPAAAASPSSVVVVPPTSAAAEAFRRAAQVGGVHRAAANTEERHAFLDAEARQRDRMEAAQHHAYGPLSTAYLIFLSSLPRRAPGPAALPPPALPPPALPPPALPALGHAAGAGGARDDDGDSQQGDPSTQ